MTIKNSENPDVSNKTGYLAKNKTNTYTFDFQNYCISLRNSCTNRDTGFINAHCNMQKTKYVSSIFCRAFYMYDLLFGNAIHDFIFHYFFILYVVVICFMI